MRQQQRINKTTDFKQEKGSWPHEQNSASDIFDFFSHCLVDKAKESQMRQRRTTVIDLLQRVIGTIIDCKVEEFKERRGISLSWFDIMQSCPERQSNLYSGNDGDLQAEYLVPRFKVIDFGSTRLGVESENSDLDLLVTTYDCLFERLPFFLKLESKMK